MYEAMIPRIVGLVDACRAQEIPVIHVKMVALPNGASDSVAWIRMRMRASGDPQGLRNGVWAFTVAGTWGAEFVPELTPAPEDIIIPKFRSSAFYETNLNLVLRSRGIKTVLVCGCTTEGCVESTVRDAGFHDYLAVVVSDCVGSDVPELHTASMFVMSAYRADVINAVDAARLLADSADRSSPDVLATEAVLDR